MTHTLSCGTGGLIITQRNKIREKLLYLARRAFTSRSVRAKPLIHQGYTRSEMDISQRSDKEKETREDVMIQGLWELQVEAIIDVKLGDTDADS